MQSVLFTAIFLRQAMACQLEEEDLQQIAITIASNPRIGDLIVGTGGARKLRHALGSKGKSGGLRTIHYFGGDDVPVFLLSVYGKSQRENISAFEKKELSKLLPQIAANYRKGKQP
jgi:hypothetical protein